MLLPRNTQHLPDTAASTLLWLMKPRLLSLREHFGGITQIFPQCDVDKWGCVWMSRFRGAWQSLKECLFGLETLVFATSGILSMHNQLVTLQRERKIWNSIIWPYLKESPKSSHVFAWHTHFRSWRHAKCSVLGDSGKGRWEPLV